MFIYNFYIFPYIFLTWSLALGQRQKHDWPFPAPISWNSSSPGSICPWESVCLHRGLHSSTILSSHSFPCSLPCLFYLLNNGWEGGRVDTSHWTWINNITQSIWSTLGPQDLTERCRGIVRRFSRRSLLAPATPRKITFCPSGNRLLSWSRPWQEVYKDYS